MTYQHWDSVDIVFLLCLHRHYWMSYLPMPMPEITAAILD